MEGSGSLDPADYSRFHGYPYLTPSPCLKPPESFWCGFLCDWTLQDFSGRLPRNDKPPERGLDAGGGMPLRFRCEVSVMVNLHRCSSRVKHPTTQPLDMG